MRPLHRLAALTLLLVAVSAALAAAPPTASRARPKGLPLSEPQRLAAEKGTHEQEKAIGIARSGGMSLQTLTVDAEGRVLGLVANSRYFTPREGEKGTSEIHLFTPEGKASGVWKLAFNGQSLNTAPDGSVFVAGDGRVAHLSKAGKLLADIELPHIKKLAEDKEALRKDAQAQIDEQKKSFLASVKQITEQKEKLEKIEEEKRTKLQKSQLKQYEAILKSYKETEKYYDRLNVDDMVKQTLSRLRIINGIAVTAKDVFIVCGESKGYGYAIWRMTREFKDAKLIKSGCRGCCGQFDIQVDGDDLLTAENCQHKWARHDRDGKLISSHGKRGNDKDVECFGGCCNPMNLRAAANGEIYTAESEGIIKRYSAKGEFLGVVGHAPLTGGCKNVGVGASPDGSRVYFCDQPGARIIVMKKKAD